MRQNHIQEDTRIDVQASEFAHPSLVAQLHARIFAAKFDRQIVAGAVPVPGSALAAHVNRLSSVTERENVARGLRNVLRGGPHNRLAAQVRVPELAARIDESRDVIDDITLRLHSQRPVAIEGMARLRMLLSDGTGPLYFQGHGSLAGELRDTLASM